MSLGHLLFSWHGRANRAKVWLFALLTVIAWTIMIVFAVVLIGADKITAASTRPDSIAMEKLIESALGAVLLLCALAVVLFYCTLAVLAKRLHDRNKSAWWLVIFVFGPAFISGLGNATGGSHAAGGIAEVFSLIALGINLWAFVELYCLRGTVGDNRYGPDPLASQV